MASDWGIDIDGVIKNFSDDLSFVVTTSFGTGVPKINNLMSPMALQPGSVFEGQNVQSRAFRLQGSIIGSTKSNAHALRQALIKASSSFKTSTSSQLPTRKLRYTGATVDKDIFAVFDGGLEDAPPLGWADIDTTLRFIAPDPLFYATSETTQALDSNDTGTVETIAGKIAGVWDTLGPPNAAGTYTFVQALAEHPTTGDIYIGGSFSNFDNIANADNIVRYDIDLGTWHALSTGLNGLVRTLEFGTDGTLYTGGQFTNAGGDADADYFAQWNGSAFSAVGTPNAGATISEITSIGIGRDAKIYVGGNFTNLAGIANADHIAFWDGSAWNAMSTGVTAGSSVNAIVIDGSNNVYAAGNFTTIGGVSAARVAKWDGSAFTALGDGLSSTVRGLALDSGGGLYATGVFASSGSVTLNKVGVWNGTVWTPLSTGFNDDGESIKVLSTGNILAGGIFDDAGGVITEGIAEWNGSVWTRPDIVLPTGSPNVSVLDTIETSANNIFIGFTYSGTAEYAGSTTEAYGGTAVTYPRIEVSRVGGTSAVLTRISNIETNATLYFNYSISDGETVTIELNPQNGIDVSSSVFGKIPSAILSNSDQSQFYLTPGNASGDNNNVITCFVDIAGAPTVTTNLIYKPAYISLD